MRNAVIVDSVRTGLAKSFRGGVNNSRAANMTSHIVNALLERNPEVDPSMVEDIILGCGNPEGAQGHNIARNVAVLSNLPIQTGGVTINRYCSSGLNSIAWGYFNTEDSSLPNKSVCEVFVAVLISKGVLREY